MLQELSLGSQLLFSKHVKLVLSERNKQRNHTWESRVAELESVDLGQIQVGLTEGPKQGNYFLDRHLEDHWWQGTFVSPSSIKSVLFKML